jgi:hypothetical protein
MIGVISKATTSDKNGPAEHAAQHKQKYYLPQTTTTERRNASKKLNDRHDSNLEEGYVKLGSGSLSGETRE